MQKRWVKWVISFVALFVLAGLFSLGENFVASAAATPTVKSCTIVNGTKHTPLKAGAELSTAFVTALDTNKGGTKKTTIQYSVECH